MNKAASRVEIVAEVVVETAVEIEVVAETANTGLDTTVGTALDVAATEAAVAAMIRVGASLAESVFAAAEARDAILALFLNKQRIMNSVRKDRALLE